MVDDNYQPEKYSYLGDGPLTMLASLLVHLF